jgi:hypothetical protein
VMRDEGHDGDQDDGGLYLNTKAINTRLADPLCFYVEWCWSWVRISLRFSILGYHVAPGGGNPQCALFYAYLSPPFSAQFFVPGSLISIDNLGVVSEVASPQW